MDLLSKSKHVSSLMANSLQDFLNNELIKEYDFELDLEKFNNNIFEIPSAESYFEKNRFLLKDDEQTDINSAQTPLHSRSSSSCSNSSSCSSSSGNSKRSQHKEMPLHSNHVDFNNKTRDEILNGHNEHIVKHLQDLYPPPVQFTKLVNDEFRNFNPPSVPPQLTPTQQPTILLEEQQPIEQESSKSFASFFNSDSNINSSTPPPLATSAKAKPPAFVTLPQLHPTLVYNFNLNTVRINYIYVVQHLIFITFQRY